MTTTITTSTTVPTGVSFWVMHHECHNDGIKIRLNAEQSPVGGTAVANKVLTVSILDSTDVVLYEITGSLDPLAKDDYGQSIYLPDVAAVVTGGAVEIGGVDPDASVVPASDAYGDAVFTSDLLQCFTEGGTTYTSTDYTRCVTALKETNIPYGYIISGGSQATDLLGKLAALAFDANVHFKYDIPGTMTPAAAITWRQSLGFDSRYCHAYWAPILADDPLNGVRAVWGTAGLNAGFSCARNARINAKGFAPKNSPIAGKAWPLNRTGMVQTYSPTESELSDLAKSQINPVLYQNYNGGGRFVFTDSLTSAKVTKSQIKLISVSEMAASIDGAVAMFANELVQLPMLTFKRRMDAFLEELFTSAQASDWLIPAKNLPGNVAFVYNVAPSQARPADLMMISYSVSYDGVARQVIIQQTLTR